MDRREVLGLLGASTVGLIGLEGAAGAQETDLFTCRSQLGAMHKRCLNACTACAAVCNEASAHCLGELGKGSEHKDHHVRAHQLAMDCAAMCGISSTLIARQSFLTAAQCNACAKACRACAAECSNAASHAEIMKDCARICQECEKTCREMGDHHASR